MFYGDDFVSMWTRIRNELNVFDSTPSAIVDDDEKDDDTTQMNDH